MQSLTPPERHFITKHASSNCGVGTTLVQWNLQEDDACPRCGQPEDSAHVYLCTGQNASVTWESNLNNLVDSLTRSQTDPSITHAIITSLSHWRQNGVIPLHLIHPSLWSVVHQQHTIGWRSLLEGAAGTQWRHAQQEYCTHLGLRQSNRRWLRATLVQLA